MLCRLSYLGVMEPGVRIELTLSRSQNERIASNAYPADLELARGLEPRFHPYQRCVLSKLDDASNVELVELLENSTTALRMRRSSS